MIKFGKIFFAIVLCALIFITAMLPVLAENSLNVSDASDTDNAFNEPPMKEYTWAYITVAILTVLGVIASAVYITKKVK